MIFRFYLPEVPRCIGCGARISSMATHCTWCWHRERWREEQTAPEPATSDEVTKLGRTE